MAKYSIDFNKIFECILLCEQCKSFCVLNRIFISAVQVNSLYQQHSCVDVWFHTFNYNTKILGLMSVFLTAR